MRLIDADELKDWIIAFGVAGYGSLQIEKITSYIDGQSTAYDADKVVEKLEERKNTLMSDFVLTDRDVGVKSNALGRINEIDGIIEIIKSGGID